VDGTSTVDGLSSSSSPSSGASSGSSSVAAISSRGVGRGGRGPGRGSRGGRGGRPSGSSRGGVQAGGQQASSLPQAAPPLHPADLARIQHGLFFYHFNFGEQAHNCVAPCNWGN
jgi:hypothetical protein